MIAAMATAVALVAWWCLLPGTAAALVAAPALWRRGARGGVCRVNADCPLPTVCCKGVVVDYCCDMGGFLERIRGCPGRNATLPAHVPWPA